VSAVRKVIVTVAPTGGFLTKRETPFVPTQPDEIAEDVFRCFNAGAAAVALHARRTDDLATCDPAIYRDINAQVRAQCGIIIGNSTGGGLNGDLVAPGSYGRLESLETERSRGSEGGADICSVNPMTVLGHSEAGDVLVSTSLEQSRALVGKMRRLGAKPEYEAFNPTHIMQDISALVAETKYDAPPWVSLCFGLQHIFQGAVPFSVRTMQYMVDQLPPGAQFNVSGQGLDQAQAVTASLLMGGHVRVGIEDSRWSTDGELRPNAWFVDWAVRQIRQLGLEVASPAEAREILGLVTEPKSPAALGMDA
jgi:3-keto-5-aminohexanoate cleavage enzyme